MVITHMADMLSGVALPSLTMSRDGNSNISIKSVTMMGLRRIVPMRCLWLGENTSGRCSRAGRGEDGEI